MWRAEGRGSQRSQGQRHNEARATRLPGGLLPGPHTARQVRRGPRWLSARGAGLLGSAGSAARLDAEGGAHCPREGGRLSGPSRGLALKKGSLQPPRLPG